MKSVNKRSKIALALVATLLLADTGMGLGLESLFMDDVGSSTTDDAVDSTERVWEGGGSHLAFVDTMSGDLAQYLEEMDPLRNAPGDGPFDYYGGAIHQFDQAEAFGLWGPERWRHEWWRWGEESFQELADGATEATLWNQDDAWPGGTFRFGDADDAGAYPRSAFSAVVSPIVDLRGVEQVTRDTEAEAEYPPPSSQLLLGGQLVGSTVFGAQDNVRDATATTGVVEVGRRSTTADVPAAQNASAALQLRHLYDFFADANGLQDGARVEVSVFDPAQGWQEWKPLVPSHNKLRLGEDEFEGRYAAPATGTGQGWVEMCRGADAQQQQSTNQQLLEPACSVLAAAQPIASDGSIWARAQEDGAIVEAGGATVDANGDNPTVAQGTDRRPWLYQGEVLASGPRDGRTTLNWNGFGSRSNAFVESVFDLSDHAGQVVRFRFVAATGSSGAGQGLGWLLDQMEVHALADSGVRILAPVTPTEGALLGMDEDLDHGGARPVVALQNTAPEDRTALVDLGIEGEEATRQRVTLPPGPWGRVFVTADQTLHSLGLEQGLHSFSVSVSELLGGNVDAEARSPVPADEARFHFLRVGADWPGDQVPWRAVRVETEAVALDEDEVHNPAARLIQRGQQMRVHVDVENLGPEPVELSFNGRTDSDLWPLLQNNRGERIGGFELVTENILEVPPSREASGSLGDPQPLRRVTWEWEGTDFAQILDLFVENEDKERVLEGGSVRVETMQPNAFDVDLGNRWDYEAAGSCERRTEDRRNVLVCNHGGAIPSPASPVLNSDLRRGEDPVLVVLHREGAGNVTFMTSDTHAPESGQRVPPPDLVWEDHGEPIEIDASENWTATEVALPKFERPWDGWIHVEVASNDTAEFLVDEIRVEVGPEGRRLPLLWHTFTGDLLPETSGRIVASGDHVAVLHGTAARPSDHSEETTQLNEIYAETRQELRDEALCVVWENEEVPLSCFPFLPPDDQLCADQLCQDDEMPWDALILNVGGPQTDAVVPGVSYLPLPGSYALTGSRPTLSFDHWMGPSVAAKGAVEVARLDSSAEELLESTSGASLTWEPVATFPAPRSAPDAVMESVELALWEYAGDDILIRFRYEYDAALQPGNAPKGWVLDNVVLEQTAPSGRQVLQPFSGNFTKDGYQGFRVDFREQVEGVQRALPTVETRSDGPSAGFAARDVWLHFPRGDPEVPVCANMDHPNTKAVGHSAITDPVDMRGMEKPIFVLEHGGAFQRDGSGRGFAGTPMMDVEWQVLGPDGTWGEWQRATPHRPWDQFGPNAMWAGERIQGQGLVDLNGDEVEEPFTSRIWGTFTSSFNRVITEGHLTGGDATVFDLTKRAGLAGEIARFRFIAWEEWHGHTRDNGFPTIEGPCPNSSWAVNDFYWRLYSMRIFEDTHVFDASVDLENNLRVVQDGRALLDELGAGALDLQEDEIVVSGYSGGGSLTVDVDVQNVGEFTHVANVTLDLVDEHGRSVGASAAPISFIEGAVPVRDRPYGSVALQGGGAGAAGETDTARFVVEIAGRGQLEPGNYTLRAVVDLDDALDTNPRNDMAERPLRVVPVRALDLDPSTLRVAPPAGVPEEPRTLHVDLRNRGNVEEREVTVKARVVELIGFGAEADIGPDGEAYELETQTVTNRGPGSTRSLTWVLEESRTDDNLLPPLEDLLQPGSRYAVNVSIQPADDSALSWWRDGAGDRVPLQLQPDGPLHDVLDAPGERCGCYHVPFIVEGLVARSDLTPEGTEAVLDGYLTDRDADGVAERWEAFTRYRQDGQMMPADDRDDLPQWEFITRQQAEERGQSGVQGAAWSLPAYDGYEVLEHELVSPPLPSHVVKETSRGILDLRYASDLADDQARVEVRTLLPGGQWGEWGSVDDLRMQRVAVVLPPDFPRVVADQFSGGLGGVARYPDSNSTGHPIPPFYTTTDPEDRQAHPWDTRQDFISCSSRTNQACTWSPFPLFREDAYDASNLQSVQALATVLGRLADELGAENVGVFTTFPANHSETQDFGEFNIPRDHFQDNGIAFDTSTIPMLRVRSAQSPVNHEIPVLGMDVLGRQVGSYGTLLVMGDGLSRWAASQEGRSDVLTELSTRPAAVSDEVIAEINAKVRDLDNGLPGVTLPLDHEGTPELERHFQELLPALRFAGSEGVRVIGATGPATASIGFSGAAEGVPLSLWIPPNTPAANNMMPWLHQCLVTGDNNPQGGQAGSPDEYWVNMTDQPKDPCWRIHGLSRDPLLIDGNYVYISSPDAQGAVLRELSSRGGAEFAHSAVDAWLFRSPNIFLPNFCNPAPDILQSPVNTANPIIYTCIIPDPVVSHQADPDAVRFITAPFARNEQASSWALPNFWGGTQFDGTEDFESWVDEIMEHAQGRGTLAAGNGDWQNLPLDMGSPVGGTFQRDEAGLDRFVGETMQFRISVRSDPQSESPGHGSFFLDSFQLFGTPRDAAELDVRIVNPRDGSLRAPGEPDFFVAVEVINRGNRSYEGPVQVDVGMVQDPWIGDCDDACIVQAFHPEGQGQGPVNKTLHIDTSIGPGQRQVITVGGPERGPDPGAPSDIEFSRDASAFNDGRFPRLPLNAPSDGRLAFNVTARLVGSSAFDQVHVAGQNLINDLVKDAGQDIRVGPSQSVHGTGHGGIVPGTDHIAVDLWLTNDGSRWNQEGSVQVEVIEALSFDCFRRSADNYRRCDSDGAFGPSNGRQWVLWEREYDVGIPRGQTVQETLMIPLAELEEAGVAPGVYEVNVTVSTARASLGQTDIVTKAIRWIYLGDPDTPDAGPWAIVHDDLSGIGATSDLNTHRVFPPTSSQPGSTSWFVVNSTASQVCRHNPNTRAGTFPDPNNNAAQLRHGWAVGGDTASPCGNSPNLFMGNGTLQWMRDSQPTAMDDRARNWDVPLVVTQSPDQAGLGDYGPDHLVWFPGHAQSPQGSSNNPIPKSGAPNRTEGSLAHFAPGEGVLVLDTRFTATEHTGYVVEMQVPQRHCVNAGTTGNRCWWQWNWSGNGSHWIPLQPEGIAPVDGDINWQSRALQPNQANCENYSPPGGGQARRCWRFIPTNPLVPDPNYGAGASNVPPGIWGKGSTDLAGNEDGWVSLRYPLNVHDQPGLRNYCTSTVQLGSANGLTDANGGNYQEPDGGGFRRCMYTFAHANTANGAHEIPRPVAFRLSAASFGGDAGLNAWHVRGISLTAHELSIAGVNDLQVSLNDGDTRIVPIEIRNDAPVDDIVNVSIDMPHRPGVHVGVARQHAAVAFQESMTLRIPAGEVRTAWVNVSSDFGVFSRPGAYDLPGISVTARSLLAETVAARAHVSGTLHQLQRADLTIGEMVVNNMRSDADGPINANVGSPVHVSLQLQNEGTRAITEPVAVRLWAQQIAETTGDAICPAEEETCNVAVAEDIVDERFDPGCFGQSHCVRMVSFQWTPEEQAIYRLEAEVNLPQPGDAIAQIPESVFGNNAETRLVRVGPVPLADLHVREASLVRFDPQAGCQQQAVERLIDGHTYCVLARVENAGNSPALRPVIQFSIGAAEAWSFGQDGGLPDPFSQQTEQWVASSPVRAVRPHTPAGEMEFRIDVDTDSTTESIAGMEHRVRLPVDDYRLDLRSSELPTLLLTKGGQATLTLDVRNTGTAVATPVAHAGELADDMRFSLVQPPPLQPGESTILTLDVRTGFSVQEGPLELSVDLSTAQDPLVRVPLPLQVEVVDDALVDTTLLPLDLVPGEATMDVVADNTQWATAGSWTPRHATGILELLEPDAPLLVDRHAAQLHSIPVQVPPHTAPGTYNGTIRFDVVHDATAMVLETPYEVEVLPAPALETSIEQDQVAAVRGVDANVTIRLDNTGNQPVEVALETSVDSGIVPHNETVLFIEAGHHELLDVQVRPGDASRSLGETVVRWRVADEDQWRTTEEPLLWSVRHLAAAVRLDSTDIDDIEVRLGREGTVRAALRNAGNAPLDAEALLVADGQIHNHRLVQLAPGAIQVVELRFQLDQAGEHSLQVVARPAGSDVTLQDAVFHDVGDVQSREVTIKAPQADQAAPALGVALLAVIFAVVAWARRRDAGRRRR